MTFEEKLSLAQAEMQAAGIKNSPLHKALLKAGLKIKPPHYYSFESCFLQSVAWMGAVLLIMTLIMGYQHPLFYLAFGLITPLGNAIYQNYQIEKHNLSSWEDL